jgi:hypothetical protein
MGCYRPRDAIDRPAAGGGLRYRRGPAVGRRSHRELACQGVAQGRGFRQGAGGCAPAPAIEPVAPPLPAAKLEAPKFEAPKSERPAPVQPSPPADPQVLENPPVAIEPPKQESPELQMKIDGGARFARPWRVWMKKTGGNRPVCLSRDSRIRRRPKTKAGLDLNQKAF